MNLLKIDQAIHVLSLVILADITPTLAMFRPYTYLKDLSREFQKKEDEEFNKEFFSDVLVKDNFNLMETEKHNPIFKWVEQHVPLEETQKKDISTKINSGSQKEMLKIQKYLEKNLADLKMNRDTLNTHFQEFEQGFKKKLGDSSNMIMFNDAQEGRALEDVARDPMGRAEGLDLLPQEEGIIEPNSGSC
jgi:hypothetical protein